MEVGVMGVTKPIESELVLLRCAREAGGDVLAAVLSWPFAELVREWKKENGVEVRLVCLGEVEGRVKGGDGRIFGDRRFGSVGVALGH